MQRRPLNVLLVEHDPEHARDLRQALDREAGEGSAFPTLEVEVVGELAGALERLGDGGIDVVLLDLDLPDSQGVATFERAYAFASDVPIVVLTEENEAELALTTVSGGAQDHLFREEISTPVLVRSLQYAVERHRLVSALKSLSLIDELTGLYNERGFLDLGRQYLKLARRNDRDVTLVFLDVDRFRTINDSLGHHVGDRALQKVGDILRATVRRSDIVARLEADEFAVLALEAGQESADMLVSRIQERIEDFNESSPEPYRLSASIGVARGLEQGGPDRLDQLLQEAQRRVGAQKEDRKVEAG